MAIIYSNGNFHVEAVNVNCFTVFRVCEYRGTESTVMDTLQSGGFMYRMRNAIAKCKERAEMASEPVDENKCEHKWQERIDSQFSSEKYGDVFCTKCGVCGELDRESGEVYWPAT